MLRETHRANATYPLLRSSLNEMAGWAASSVLKMFLSRATEKIGSYTENLSCVHLFRAVGSCTPLVSYGRVLWGLPLLPPLHGSCAHGGCFYRLADSTSKYVRSWRLRTLFSILVVCILFGILWNESFLCRSLLAASLGEKEKEEESAR